MNNDIINIFGGPSNGIGIQMTGVTGASLGILRLQPLNAFLDISKLRGYTADKSVIQDQNILIFDDDEPGVIKTKKISFDKLLAERLLGVVESTTLETTKPAGNFFDLNINITGSNQISVVNNAKIITVDLIKVDGGTY